MPQNDIHGLSDSSVSCLHCPAYLEMESHIHTKKRNWVVKGLLLWINSSWFLQEPCGVSSSSSEFMVQWCYKNAIL
jgi:hypothetical protein